MSAHASAHAANSAMPLGWLLTRSLLCGLPREQCATCPSRTRACRASCQAQHPADPSAAS